MSIQLIETYEEDSYIAVAAHVGALLDGGEVRLAGASKGMGARLRAAAYALRLSGQALVRRPERARLCAHACWFGASVPGLAVRSNPAASSRKAASPPATTRAFAYTHEATAEA